MHSTELYNTALAKTPTSHKPNKNSSTNHVLVIPAILEAVGSQVCEQPRQSKGDSILKTK